jgi:hypothetical protein
MYSPITMPGSGSGDIQSLLPCSQENDQLRASIYAN